MPPELNAEESKHILGAQGQLWSEWIPHTIQMEFMAWPRLSALAEVTWSPKESRNFADFVIRLKPDLEKLKMFGVSFRLYTPMPKPMAQWKSGDAIAQFTEHEWEVTPAITAPGQYLTAFVQTGGHGHTEVEWIELRENGQVVQRITRPVTTDFRQRANDYIFGLQTYHPGSHYTIRASMRNVGGVDAAGDIYFVSQ